MANMAWATGKFGDVRLKPDDGVCLPFSLFPHLYPSRRDPQPKRSYRACRIYTLPVWLSTLSVARRMLAPFVLSNL